MNEMNDSTTRASSEAATNAHMIWEREEALRMDCGRLLRRELGFYFEGEHGLRTFRIARALEELRRIHAELEAILRDEAARN